MRHAALIGCAPALLARSWQPPADNGRCPSNRSIAFFGTREFDITIKRAVMNPDSNRRGSNEAMVYGKRDRSARNSDAFSH